MQVISPGGTVKAGLYEEEEPGVFSTTLSSSLGLSLPNPAPEIDMGVKNSGWLIFCVEACPRLKGGEAFPLSIRNTLYRFWELG